MGKIFFTKKDLFLFNGEFYLDIVIVELLNLIVKENILLNGVHQIMESVIVSREFD